MIKYLDYAVTFEEVPDEITLAINITNCQMRCEGCHSPELRLNIGEWLSPKAIDDMIEKNDGITCVCLMGEGNDRDGIFDVVHHLIANHPKLKRAIYYGRDELDGDYANVFDYVKYGHYDAEAGPLNKETTNQRFYGRDEHGEMVDMTYKFWKRM